MIPVAKIGFSKIRMLVCEILDVTVDVRLNGKRCGQLRFVAIADMRP